MGNRAELTDAVLRALERARDEARTHGHGYIGTEHLVIVLSETGRAADNLRAQGIAPDDLRRNLREIFDANRWNRYVPDEELLATVGVDLDTVRATAEAEFGDGALPMRRGAPGFTRRVVTILKSASTGRAPGQKAGIDDVFAALLADEDSVGVSVLRRAGADIDALRASVG